MNGELALAISLTAHGNAYLTSARGSAPAELVGTNSTLQYVRSLLFRNSEPETPLQSMAEAIRRTEQGRFEDLRSTQGTSAWFLKLNRAGASKLRLVKLPTQVELPEVHASAFSGGIPWAILIDFPDFFGVWIPRWKHEGGEKPWMVSVTGFTTTNPPQPAALELNAAASSLEEVLKRALDFSTRAKLEWFPANFSQALALLDSSSPVIPYHPDLLPSTGYSLLARQLTASAATAWVFGGMGSFNDVWFEGAGLNAEHKALVPTLYTSVVNALFAATNSFGRV